MKKFFKNREQIIVLLLVLGAVTFTIFFFWPEITHLTTEDNDNAFAFASILKLKEIVETGGNPLDFWVDLWGIGYPLFHYYQFLPSFVVLATYYLFFKVIPLFSIFSVIKYLTIFLFPLSVYYSMKKIGFKRIPSALSALFSSLISDSYLYGLGFESYSWEGFGMFSQSFAVLFMPLSIAFLYKTIKEGKHFLTSLFLLVVTFLSQVFYGYMVALYGLVFVVLASGKNNLFLRLKRLLVIGTCSFIILSFWLIPLMLDEGYHNISFWDAKYKWDSYGAAYTIRNFINGNILDYNRLPTLTLMAIIGLSWAGYTFYKKREEKQALVLFGFLLFFVLFWGRTTWGFLVDLLPFTKEAYLHRFIGGLHLFAIYAAGIGLFLIWKKIRYKDSVWRLVLCLAVTILIFAPLYKERLNYYQKNKKDVEVHASLWQKDYPNFQKIVQKIKESSYARVYPGKRGNWGKDFRIGLSWPYWQASMEEIPTLSNPALTWSLNAETQEFMDESRWDHYNLYNVRYIIAPLEKTFPNFAKKVAQEGSYILYEVPTTGFFDVVRSNTAVFADKNTIPNPVRLWMGSDWISKKDYLTIVFDIKNFQELRSSYRNSLKMLDSYTFVSKGRDYHILDTNPFLPIDIVAPTGKIIEENKEKNDVYSVEVEIGEGELLVFKMTYHPNWHVYVDGQEVEKLMLSPSFIGVKPDSGKHKIVFVYKQRFLKSALCVFSTVFLVGLVVIVKKRTIFMPLF